MSNEERKALEIDGYIIDLNCIPNSKKKMYLRIAQVIFEMNQKELIVWECAENSQLKQFVGKVSFGVNLFHHMTISIYQFQADKHHPGPEYQVKIFGTGYHGNGEPMVKPRDVFFRAITHEAWCLINEIFINLETKDFKKSSGRKRKKSAKDLWIYE